MGSHTCRFHWWVIAFEFIILAGITAATALNRVPKTKLSWMGMFTVASVLYIYGTGQHHNSSRELHIALHLTLINLQHACVLSVRNLCCCHDLLPGRNSLPTPRRLLPSQLASSPCSTAAGGPTPARPSPAAGWRLWASC